MIFTVNKQFSSLPLRHTYWYHT